MAFPNAVLVSARGRGQHATGAATSGDGQLLFSQINEVQRAVDAARTGVIDPRSAVELIDRVRDMLPTYGRAVRVIGYALLSAALAVLLGASWTGVLLSAALGVVVGGALLVSERVPRSVPWIVLVLYIAYSAQVLGDLLVGGVLSAFVGALCVTPVTALVARQPSGPAAMVSFTPAFWLLVPGALGLISVADVLGGDSAAQASLVTTLSTMLAIALGVLAGSGLSNRMRRPAL